MSKRKLLVPSAEEDAQIARGIANDPDAVELSDEQIAEAARIKRRGRPLGSVAEVRKEPVTMRLDPDVLEALHASGPGWQSRVNEIPRKAVLSAGRATLLTHAGSDALPARSASKRAAAS